MPALTDEQKIPLAHARSPSKAVGRRPTVVATVAGPGSGKTTMQEGLAVTLRRKGHERVLKVFFNRKAADDGRERLDARLKKKGVQGGVECLTTHGAALRYACTPMGDNLPGRCVDEAALQEVIQERFSSQIAAWHGERPHLAPANKREEAEKVAANKSKLVAFYIFKTFVNWLASDVDEATLRRPPGTFDKITYYPAKKDHREKLPKCRTPNADGWYMQRARELWRLMVDEAGFPLVHDAYLKWAQLHGADMRGFSALLLDEAQDLTECQLNLFVTQQSHADIFVVGDMAQALYAWRLAAPKQLASLGEPKSFGAWFYTLAGQLQVPWDPPNPMGPHHTSPTRPHGTPPELQEKEPRRKVIVTKLTRTFRFGGAIGRVANGVLHVKEHSAQTKETNKLWVPYRITPRDGAPGRVTRDELAFPKTIIGRTNFGLALAGWELLDQHPGIRIALNGDGDGAGRNKFATVFRQLRDALKLYHRQQPAARSPFAAYQSWDELKADIEERELNQYNMHVNLVERYGEPADAPPLEDMIERFKTQILTANHRGESAEVLLSTVCQAKGLEWTRVEVLDDCIPLDVMKADDGRVLFAPDHSGGDPSKRSRPDYKGDEVTHCVTHCARRRLSLALKQGPPLRRAARPPLSAPLALCARVTGQLVVRGVHTADARAAHAREVVEPRRPRPLGRAGDGPTGDVVGGPR